MPFAFERQNIPELILIKPKILRDDRGFFLEVFKNTDFTSAGITEPIVQINHSHSAKNVLRGLHFQVAPYAQGKIVTATQGEIFDVAIDVQPQSPTYGKWVGTKLNDKNQNLFYIPKGFAHGFCVLSDTADVVYLCTGHEYVPQHERGLIWNDPKVNIAWPINKPILSEKDLKNATWEKLEKFN